jgi:hypothetical protein
VVGSTNVTGGWVTAAGGGAPDGPGAAGVGDDQGRGEFTVPVRGGTGIGHAASGVGMLAVSHRTDVLAMA